MEKTSDDEVCLLAVLKEYQHRISSVRQHAIETFFQV
jgi:hypothetical protein